MRARSRITVFEHQYLPMGTSGLDDRHLVALERWVRSRRPAPFVVSRRGLRFSSWVGVVQVHGLVIEVLPKCDREEEHEATRSRWRRALIDMLQIARAVPAQRSVRSGLSVEKASVLDFVFQVFLSLVDEVVSLGLAKDYLQTEGNLHTVRGRIVFHSDVRHNVAHRERSYCRYRHYSVDTALNRALRHALSIVARSAGSPQISAEAKGLLLAFERVSDVEIGTEELARITLNRKTDPYRDALDLARLIVLGHATTPVSGRDEVLALVFDMNTLFERYVYRLLKRAEGSVPDLFVQGQVGKRFWERKLLRPDIVLDYRGKRTIVDTKWKIPRHDGPADADLKQMYAYNRIFGSRDAVLLYPANAEANGTGVVGSFADNSGECATRFLDLFDDAGKLRTLAGPILQDVISDYSSA